MASEYGSLSYGSRTPEQIVSLYHERRLCRSPILTQMMRLRAAYNADLLIPIQEMDRSEQQSTANLIQQGLDSQAQRIASVVPDLACPPIDPRNNASVTRATNRKKATLAWWQENGVQRQMRRRARWLVGYGTAPVTLRPNFADEIPCWDLRNPLDAFPAETVNPDDMCPDNTIFAVRKPVAWLRARYPEQAKFLVPQSWPQDHKITVLEYDDAEQYMVIACNTDSRGAGSPKGYAQHLVLENFPNRAEIALSVHPGRITLDRLLGQFDGVVGMAEWQSKLMALDVLAVQKFVFPALALVGNQQGQEAKLVDGEWHEGVSGLINTVIDGTVQEFPMSPGSNTSPMIDRIERNIRIAGGVPQDTTGESATGVRTGRRGDSILSATLDPMLQESQETFAASMEAENVRATRIAKAYFGNVTKSFYVKSKGAKGHATYTPNKDFDSDYSQVTFPVPGSDANNLIIGLGQRVGSGMMSTQTAMRLDPYVDDADMEQDRVVTEAMQRAILSGFEQGLASGQVPISDGARVQQLVLEDNLEPYKAILQAQKEAQDRQASVDAQGQSTAVDPNSPAAQPGLAVPGAGAEAGASIPPPSTSMQNLSALMMASRDTAPHQSVA